MKSTIKRVDIHCLKVPRDEPYLGQLEEENSPNAKDYFIRPGNKSIYSLSDLCVLVRLETEDGTVGWGECVSVVAPEVAATVIGEIAAPVLLGKDVLDSVALHEDLYDTMRVRGFFGGFFVDGLCAIDIAVWDAKARILGCSLAHALGACRRTKIPAYVSGLPRPTIPEKVALAKGFQAKGFNAFKFASAVSGDLVVDEMRALREGLGSKAQILCDMHWKHTPAEAIRLIHKLEPYDLRVAEAPVPPEDIAGQARVVRAVGVPVGIGEELRTPFEFRPRFEAACMDVIQPEMGRTGITNFMDICRMARAWNCEVMPHASIGIGIFQAASLHATAALPNATLHEYQHSIFDKNLHLVTGDMRCDNGEFTLPSGPGLGVAPTDEALAMSTRHETIQ